MVLRTVSRTTNKNDLKVTVAGQLMIHALVRLDESTDPMGVDYYNLGGACKGTIQYGLLRWEGEELCSCMAAPDQSRSIYSIHGLVQSFVTRLFHHVGLGCQSGLR